jgi:hypothetical protein
MAMLNNQMVSFGLASKIMSNLKPSDLVNHRGDFPAEHAQHQHRKLSEIPVMIEIFRTTKTKTQPFHSFLSNHLSIIPVIFQ